MFFEKIFHDFFSERLLILDFYKLLEKLYFDSYRFLFFHKFRIDLMCLMFYVKISRILLANVAQLTVFQKNDIITIC